MTTTAAIKAEAKAPPPPLQPIDRDRLRPSQEVRMLWRLVVPSVEHYRNMLAGDTRLFMHVGDRINAGDVLEILDDTASFRAEAYVRLAIRTPGGGSLTHIELVEVSNVKLGEPAEEAKALGEWSVQWKGPHLRWCVVRPDGSTLRAHIFTREEAVVVMSQQAVRKAHGVAVTY